MAAVHNHRLPWLFHLLLKLCFTNSRLLSLFLIFIVFYRFVYLFYHRYNNFQRNNSLGSYDNDGSNNGTKIFLKNFSIIKNDFTIELCVWLLVMYKTLLNFFNIKVILQVLFNTFSIFLCKCSTYLCSIFQHEL